LMKRGFGSTMEETKPFFLALMGPNMTKVDNQGL
jgi:hypothetical protein